MFKQIRSLAEKFRVNKIKENFYLNHGLMKSLNLQEYEAKILFKNNHLDTEQFYLVKTTEEALHYSKKLNYQAILKCQVHAGGRGKGHLTSGLKGGIQICKSKEDIINFSNKMLGFNLITNQTPNEGLLVKNLLISEIIDIKKLFYLAFILDRKYQGPVILASNEGGVNIEEVSKNQPESLIVEPINILKGLTDENVMNVVSKLNFSEKERNQAIVHLRKLYNLFLKYDALQIEINPWAVDSHGKLFLLDAKVNIDDSARYRQSQVFNLKEKSEVLEDIDPNEIKANDVGISYVGLSGNIGCMVNGAGLAMATMDLIKLKGGDPANFLDVGGGADENQVTQAFQILNNQDNVKAILINIFGGIMKCDIIANGIIKAAILTGVRVPIVVRLTGTNSEEGKRLINEFAEKHLLEYRILTANDLDEAAEKVVKVLRK